LAAGVLILALGSALTPFTNTGLGLVLTIGLLSASGSGAASFSVLIGAVARLLPPQHRGTAAGIINAGGSFGQFIFAPLECQDKPGRSNILKGGYLVGCPFDK
jgi:MFS family permease